MSVDLHNLVNPNLQDSGHYSASPEHVDATASSCDVKTPRSHDEEESYEAFGSVEGDADDGVDSPGGSSSAPSPTGTNSLKNPRSPNSTIGRHSWLRTSLRRTPSCQLYRSGSFNSSGRGSNCDPADDMYSDVSLEDDVIDLNHKTAKSKRDAKQNFPAEFILFSELTAENDRQYVFCDGCDGFTSGTDNNRGCVRDESRNTGIIEFLAEKKTNVGTNMSGTTMSRSTAT
ncbi:uncharacterized protein LOC128872802 [Hylaeus volcanicus]|uniref:uncharacterized protein LOC128872802 n=1 Tax=Hylaeus volcanicus TaxID=313075 RepID=UPI0023B81348|nr:uncharacterized protein LOC128872802 [Hylaeus volcanicus]